MARTYTVTEYEKEDIDALVNMSDEEVAECLERIKRGWMPQNYTLYPEPDKTYTEDEYDAARLHMAINKAINAVCERNRGATHAKN